MSNTVVATQTHDCDGAPDQISLKRGEVLDEIEKDVDGWTRVRNKAGEEGLVMTKYLGLDLFCMYTISL